MPETQNFEEWVSQYVSSVHQDENIPKISNLFKKICSENTAIFEDKTELQKGLILFNCYREIFVLLMKDTPEYKEIVSRLTGLFSLKEDKVNKYMRKVIRQRIKTYHCTYSEVAIARALDINGSLSLHAASSKNTPNISLEWYAQAIKELQKLDYQLFAPKITE